MIFKEILRPRRDLSPRKDVLQACPPRAGLRLIGTDQGDMGVNNDKTGGALRSRRPTRIQASQETGTRPPQETGQALDYKEHIVAGRPQG